MFSEFCCDKFNFNALILVLDIFFYAILNYVRCVPHTHYTSNPSLYLLLNKDVTKKFAKLDLRTTKKKWMNLSVSRCRSKTMSFISLTSFSKRKIEFYVFVHIVVFAKQNFFYSLYSSLSLYNFTSQPFISILNSPNFNEKRVVEQKTIKWKIPCKRAKKLYHASDIRNIV